MKKLILLAALSITTSAFAEEAASPKILSAEGGRFVYGQVNGARADQYMLDTKTGKLWQLVQATRPGAEGGARSTYLILQPVVYRDGQGTESAAPGKTLDEGFGEYLKTNPKK